MAYTKPRLLHGELCYLINGVLFFVHNELGRFAREKQYADMVEEKFKEKKIKYKRECVIGDSGNILDFLVEDVVVLELKAKPFLLLADYDQVQRYLHQCDSQLGILVNFRTKFIQPKRILRKKYL